MSQAAPGASQSGAPTVAPVLRRISTAACTVPSIERRAGRIGQQDENVFHVPALAAASLICKLPLPAMTDNKTVLVVTGPTASGKSALALAFARMRGGTVINADAMQTYDAFPILTAQPTAEERAAVPHTLYGVLPLRENLSAGRWSAMASTEIERCLAAGRLPILCGGSGLYIRTLMQGISPIPEVPAAIREQGNADWQTMGGPAFRARLAERDPDIVAALKPEDRQRHVRAWEVLEATGKPLSAWQKGEEARRRRGAS